MGALAARLAELLREWGLDERAHQADLQGLESLEARDAKAAQARFHELRARRALERRGELISLLRSFPFVDGLPDPDGAGMGERHVEREIRRLLCALRHVRAVQADLDEAARLRASLRTRHAPPPPPVVATPWDRLEPLAEGAEASRRAAAREARVESRAQALQRRAAKLRHRHLDLPDLSSEGTPDPTRASARLDALEAEATRLEALEEAHGKALAPLGDPAVAQWTKERGRALRQEADALVASPDVDAALDALRRLWPRTEALRAEAATRASRARQAKRRGEAAPEPERRRGDPMDPYA